MHTNSIPTQKSVASSGPRVLCLAPAQDTHLMTELGEVAREHDLLMDAVGFVPCLDQLDLSHYEVALVDMSSMNEPSERKLLHMIERKLGAIAVVLTGTKTLTSQETRDFIDLYIPKSVEALLILESDLEIGADELLEAEDDRRRKHETQSNDHYLNDLQTLNFWW